MISYPFLHRPEGGGGSPYVNGLFWVIYDRLATFTQMGAYSLSSAKRGVDLTQEEFPAVNASVAGAALPQVSYIRFGGSHAVTLPPARRFPSAWSPTSKACSSSAPTGSPPTRVSQRSQMHTSSRPWPASTSFRTSTSRQVGKFFQAYGFVAREGEEDEEADSAAATAAVEAASAAEAAAVQAAAASTPRYSLD
jgi:hypothetical protein